jgi:hypothetical protein
MIELQVVAGKIWANLQNARGGRFKGAEGEGRQDDDA